MIVLTSGMMFCSADEADVYLQMYKNTGEVLPYSKQSNAAFAAAWYDLSIEQKNSLIKISSEVLYGGFWWKTNTATKMDLIIACCQQIIYMSTWSEDKTLATPREIIEKQISVIKKKYNKDFNASDYVIAPFIVKGTLSGVVTAKGTDRIFNTLVK